MLRTTLSKYAGWIWQKFNTAAKLVEWTRVSGKGLKNQSSWSWSIFGANLNILISSVTLYGRAENNLPNNLSFIAQPKQLQG